MGRQFVYICRGLRPFRLIACLSLLASGCITDSIVLGPRNTTLCDTRGAHVETVQTAGRSIQCWVARSPGVQANAPDSFELFFVGRADRADRWITAIAGSQGSKSVEVWGMNYPGVGGSTGPGHVDNIAPAALATYDAIRRAAGNRPIWVDGTSMGTAVALYIASQRPVAGLVLQKPIPLRQLILGRDGWWNLWLLAGPISWQIPSELDGVASASRSTCPAVFLIAEDDEVVPAKYSQLIVDAYAGPKRVIVAHHLHHHEAPSQETAAELAAAIDWMTGVAAQRNGRLVSRAEPREGTATGKPD